MSSNETITVGGDDAMETGNGGNTPGLGPNECCVGSFHRLFQGPAYGIVTIVIMAASCAPVVWLLFNILCGRQRFHEQTSSRNQRQRVPRSPSRKRQPPAPKQGKNGGRRLSLDNKPQDEEEGGGTMKAAKTAKKGGKGNGVKLQKKQQKSTKNGNMNKNKAKKTNKQTVLYHIPKKQKKKPITTKKKQGSTEQRNQPSFSNRSSTKPTSDSNIQPALSLKNTNASEIDPKIRRQLLISGFGKIVLRIYVGFYVSAAAGSAHQCPNDCVKDGYGHEAFVLGYVSLIAAGLLDSVSLFRNRSLPLGRSISQIRWKRLQQLELRRDTTSINHCSLKFKRPSTTIGLVFLMAALVSLIGHLQGASDVAEVVAVLVGIICGLLAVIVMIALIPSILCDGYGFMGRIPIMMNTSKPKPGTRISLESLKCCAGYWDAIRSILFVIPGLLICLVGGNWVGVGGWILESIDLMGDFWLDHPYMLTRGV